MWALECRRSGSLANPYEHREMLNAAYGWSGKTVAQVAAEHKKRRTTKTKAGEAPAHAPVRKSEIDRMKDLFARGKAAREARAGVASEP